MFIRTRKRKTVEGETTHFQLVRSYRDGEGRVRQEVMSVMAPTVAKSLADVRSRLRWWRRKRNFYVRAAHPAGSLQWAYAEEAKRRVAKLEKRLAMLIEAERLGVP